MNIYPEITRAEELGEPDYTDDIEVACEEIKEACAGWGTDEGGLIATLGSKKATDRYLISRKYADLNDGKLLKKKIDRECGDGDFGRLMQFLAQPIEEAECEMIDLALKGLGANEYLLFPILCGRTNEEMEILKKAYFRLNEKDLAVVLNEELGGDFERLIFFCIQAAEETFDEDYHTEEKAVEDAEAFYEAGQGSWGTDEGKMFKLLVNAPPEHFKKVNAAYLEKYEYTLDTAMAKELGGDCEKAARFIVGMKTKPYETIANLIKSTCAGFGTDELALSCALVRYGEILPDVMAAHEELFDGKTLLERVKDETRGDYEKLLVAMIGEE